MSLNDLDNIRSNLEKDLAMVDHADFQGHCEKCTLPVFNDTGPGITYTQDGIQHAFHRKCFSCSACNKAIEDGSFYTHLEKPHCRLCYEAILGQCDACGENLVGTAVMKAGEKRYHPSCFNCKKCNTELQGRYFEKDGGFWCRSCYEAEYIPTCDACLEKILPDEDSGKITMVEWKDKKLHAKCYACSSCHEQFQEMKSFYHKSEPYCQNCYLHLVRSLDEEAKATAES
ncbi:hypothetical protein DFS34DRAFT_651508 [Phlyctochytrium arcticum]|nr:hypothetical protein DFS34DRAFT_651508 [Phlyctochytrium arcticum]